MTPRSESQHGAHPSAGDATPGDNDGSASGRVTPAPHNTDDAATMLRRVVETARELAIADAVAVLLYNPEQAAFVPVVPSVAVGLDERWLQRQGLEAAQTLAVRAAQAGDIVIVPDTSTTPELEFPLLAGRRPPGAVCVAPLVSEGAVIGVLELFHATPRITPYPIDALRAFASLASLAIANSQAHKRERTLRARLEALDEASQALASELALDEVLQRIVEVAARLVGARYGALGVAGPDGYLTDFITTGLTPDERARLGPLPRGHGLLGVLIRQGVPLRVPHIQRDPRRVGFPPHHPPMTSLLGVPIRVRHDVVGDLYLTDKIGAPEFTDEDQRLIELLAAHAGAAIENARLYAQVGELTLLRERDRIGRDLHDGVIQDIFAATLQLEGVAEDVAEAALQTRLLHVAEQLSGVIRDVRSYIQGLAARELEGRLLGESITALAQAVNGQGGLLVTSDVEGTPYRLPDAVAHTLLQMARESLSNVVKHAQATQAHVHLGYEAERVTLTIADNGRGFDPQGARGVAHRGLRNLRSRAAEVAGQVSVQSSTGAGTTVSIAVPRPDE